MARGLLAPSATIVINVSSEYAGEDGDWDAIQALGAPDTFDYGSAATAWGSQYANDGLQTITVGFAVPDYAVGFIIRESAGNGFVTKVEVQYLDNSYDVVWDDTDPTDNDAVHDGPGSG